VHTREAGAGAAAEKKAAPAKAAVELKAAAAEKKPATKKAALELKAADHRGWGWRHGRGRGHTN
jgi:hypothetical protein